MSDETQSRPATIVIDERARTVARANVELRELVGKGTLDGRPLTDLLQPDVGGADLPPRSTDAAAELEGEWLLSTADGLQLVELASVPDTKDDDGFATFVVSVVMVPPQPGAHELPLRVVLVEDDPDHAALTVLTMGVSPRFELVGKAVAIEHGLELVRSLQPDVLVLDKLLPDGDGAVAVPRFRRACPTAHVVLLTSQPVALVTEQVRQHQLSYIAKNAISNLDAELMSALDLE